MTALERIVRVLEDETTFGFGEIRLDPDLNDVFKQNELLYNTINLFSFGSYKDYIENREKYIELSDSSLYKMRQLTLISEALESSTLKYDLLKDKLLLDSDRDLERLIVESIYSKIIEAKVFSQQRYLKVSTCRGRDVLLSTEAKLDYEKITTVTDLLKGLEKFSRRIDAAFAYTEEVGSGLKLKVEEPESRSGETNSQETVNTDGFLPDGRRHSCVGMNVLPIPASMSLPEVSEVNIASFNGRKRKTQD